jgi:hypothetical protein
MAGSIPAGPIDHQRKEPTMLTPSPDHYMRQLTDAQLETMLADPIHFGVSERLDADAILQERYAHLSDLPVIAPAIHRDITFDHTDELWEGN